METKLKKLLKSCSELDFGVVNISEEEIEFYHRLNHEVILLCKSLPESTRTEAFIFFMRYSGLSFGEKLNFFRHYHVPSWSIIYWLTKLFPVDKKLTEKDIKNAITAHSMAMCLHSLDDHLSDGEMPVTHLNLLLRSQSWMIMNNAFKELAARIDGGKKIVRDFIDDYYASISGSEEVLSLDRYCDLFRKQMATGMIVPALTLKKMACDEEIVSAIQAAYGSFGVAWRLLDDIKDIETDMMKCMHSSIYVCLPESAKNYWDKHVGEQSDKKSNKVQVILNCLLENGIINVIKKRICNELQSATSVVARYGMSGLADEFRCLARPLKNGQDPL
jgi:hypothetical protein